MITKELLELIHEAASMQRWNDHIRPHNGFTELDKQAHKMVFAYVLARFEESDHGLEIDWCHLIEGGLFEMLHRILLTDIKPPVFHRLMAKKGEQLNRWVIEKLEERNIFALEGGFKKRFTRYFFDPSYCALEKKILRASHYLATDWEFKIIYPFCKGFYGVEETKQRIANEIEDHYDLAGVQKISLGLKTANFLDLIGQLRFQERWSQTPRIPRTSVLGHMLVVAIMSYLVSYETGACRKRLYNNYFAGLFHDLPEVLTRDIVSPVKSAIDELDSIIKEIENSQIEEKIFPLLPEGWHSEIEYFTQDEFSNKIIIDGKVNSFGKENIPDEFNNDIYSPLDGQIIRGCDKLAVFLEAYLSVRYGIDTHVLREGYNNTFKLYKDSIICGYNFGKLFNYFRL